MKLPATLLLLIGISLFGGCAGPGSLVVGQSTEADVRARMGAPTNARTDPDGDRIWEYTTGPEGFYTYVIRMGADGKVKNVAQVLTEEQLAKIIPNKTTKTEVRQLLGRPSHEDKYGVGLTWSWRYKKGDVQPGYLVVTFNPDDTVRDTIAIIDFPGDHMD
jgi:hypothetical protein